jgi:hypothetical protein
MRPDVVVDVELAHVSVRIGQLSLVRDRIRYDEHLQIPKSKRVWRKE